ncbi:hypothetical protein [Corynebacterium sp. AOP12-C2-36]|uniref:hypothetical protein n=1 Tax=Corynebacterium sp. AOP12-C2-36 TaxID=3457723 RepID=UPI004034AB6A
MTTSAPHLLDRGVLHSVEWAVLSGGPDGLCGYCQLPDAHPWSKDTADLPQAYTARVTHTPADGGYVTLRLAGKLGATGKDVRNEIIALVKSADNALCDVVIP